MNTISSNIIDKNSILNILANKASKNDGLSSLQKTTGNSSSILFSLPNNIYSEIKLTSDNSLNLLISSNSIFKATPDTINFNSNINTTNMYTDNVYVNSHVFADTIITNNITTIQSLKATNIKSDTMYVDNVNIEGNISLASQLYANSASINNIRINNIIGNNSILTILGNNINIGNPESTTTIKGRTNINYIHNSIIANKTITLNVDDVTKLPNDNGGNCGFKIYGAQGDGFLMTNNSADRFIIKAPLNYTYGYIATLDNNNNLEISGTSVFYNSVTINSNLQVSGQTIIKNNVTINSNLFASDMIINNNLTSLNYLLTQTNFAMNWRKRLYHHIY